MFVNLSYLNTNREKNRGPKTPVLWLFNLYQPTEGAVRATGVDSTCQVEGEVVSVTLMHHFHTKTSLFRTSAQVLITLPCDSTMDWLKLKPFRLNAMVDTPRAVNQIPTTAMRKKCSERELLNEAVLEDETTEVTVGCDDVIGLFFLTELVTVVLGLSLSGFTNQ